MMDNAGCEPEFDAVNLTVVEDDIDPGEFPEFDCIDCGVNTLLINEYYMVHDHVWGGEAGLRSGDGMLCIGCLESRIYRPLSFDDFTDFPINWIAAASGSDRLVDRLNS